jgi:hypothetical protein
MHPKGNPSSTALADQPVASVVPLKAVPSSKVVSAPVSVEELTRWELSIALYVADRSPCLDESIGSDLLDIAACAAEGVERVGIDLVREVGALVDYADQAFDRPLHNAVFPDMWPGEDNLYNRTRASDAVNDGRRLWTELHKPSLMARAAVLRQWEPVRDECLLSTEDQWQAWQAGVR